MEQNFLRHTGAQRQPTAAKDQSAEPGPLSLREYYELIRSQLDRESELLNEKLIWHVVSQSFIVGAYAAVLNAPEKARSLIHLHQQNVFFWALPLAAMLVAVITYVSILVSLRYMGLLRRRYEDYASLEKSSDRARLLQLLPPIHGEPRLRRVSLLAPVLLPAIFTLMWVVLLMNQLYGASTR